MDFFCSKRKAFAPAHKPWQTPATFLTKERLGTIKTIYFTRPTRGNLYVSH
jgi:hypothetical protein